MIQSQLLVQNNYWVYGHLRISHLVTQQNKQSVKSPTMCYYLLPQHAMGT